jgi:hypothetical protein
MTTLGSQSFAEVARLIAPKDTPSWLPDLLAAYGREIAQDRDILEALPSKAAMRNRLLDSKEAAERIISLLNDQMTIFFMYTESGIRLQNAVQFESQLKQFVKATELAAASPMVAAAGGKTKRGRGKAMVRTAPLPKSFCALVIAETWRFARRRRPAPRNQEAASAAQAYWLACGGTAKGWGADRRTGWSYYFRDARSGSMRMMRADVRQKCTENERASRHRPSLRGK